MDPIVTNDHSHTETPQSPQSTTSTTSLGGNNNNNNHFPSLGGLSELGEHTKKSVLSITSSSTSLKDNNASEPKRKKSLSLRSILSPRKKENNKLLEEKDTLSDDEEKNNSKKEELENIRKSKTLALRRVAEKEKEKQANHSNKSTLSNLFNTTNNTSNTTNNNNNSNTMSDYSLNDDTQSTTSMDLDRISMDSLSDKDIKELKDSINGLEKELIQKNSASPTTIGTSTGNNNTSSNSLGLSSSIGSIGGSIGSLVNENQVPKAGIYSPSPPTNPPPNRGQRSATEIKGSRRKSKTLDEKESGSLFGAFGGGGGTGDSDMDLMSFLQELEEKKQREKQLALQQQQQKKKPTHRMTLTERLKKAYMDHVKKDTNNEGSENDGGSDNDSDDEHTENSIIVQLEEEYKGMNANQIIEAERKRRIQEKVFSPLTILRQYDREKKLSSKYKVVNVYFEKISFM
ncbi:hypothetical protein ABK040_011783 [Willaertia magna]